MKYIKSLLSVLFTLLGNVFSQQLPEFTVTNSSNNPSIYFSRIAFDESESQKIGDDYLFTSSVRPDNDTIITDTLFFCFNDNIVRIRIKEISFSRNEVEYISVNSFTASDTSKWKLFGKPNDDSIQFLDTLLYIKLSTKKGYLKLQLDKEYAIKKDDVFKILLDTLPQREIVGLLSREHKSVNIFPNKTTMVFSFLGTKIPSVKMIDGDLFNFAGKRQYLFHKGSNVYIYKLK
jgi:hypothetical protein